MLSLIGLGCWQDDLIDHVLPYMKLESDAMTWELCRSTCRKAKFNYAGIEEGRYCYCGQSGYDKLGASKCTTVCSGNSMQICGGDDDLTVIRSCPPKQYGTDCQFLCMDPDCDECDVDSGICLNLITTTKKPDQVTPQPPPQPHGMRHWQTI